MEIIEYFTSENKAHRLSEIKKADWNAAKFLAHLLSARNSWTKHRGRP